MLRDDEHEKYLGRKLSLKDSTAVEPESRISAAWAAFGRLKHVLCNRRISFSQRFRLFEAAVKPVMLYGAAAWTMTAALDRRLETTRRCMLRKLLMLPRRLDECWVDYVSRSTHQAEYAAARAGGCSWVSCARQRKWKFAGSVARRMDGRWTRRLLNWAPWFRCSRKRSQGHPVTRWADSIMVYAGGDWTDVAQDRLRWEQLGAGFR